MLALDAGGSCNGIAFRIATEDIESETEILWMREMLSGAYKTHWGNLKTKTEVIQGLTFVMNRSHSRYVGKHSLDKTVEALNRGEGYLGTCREYLENTVQCLSDIDIHDNYLNLLCKKLKNKNPPAERVVLE